MRSSESHARMMTGASAPASLAGAVMLGLIAVGILSGHALGAEPVPKKEADPDGVPWAQPRLVGRLIVAQPKILETGWFDLKAELRNVGTAPAGVEIGNPFKWDVRVADGKGQAVKQTSGRYDVIYQPTWAEIPPKSSLTVQVSRNGDDRAKGSHLDTTTSIWKLAPGKYKLSATYKGWGGNIAFPGINVEIVPAETRGAAPPPPK